MSFTSLASLLRDGRIERIEADIDAARGRIEIAKRHLESAEAIAAVDPDGTYILLYDAARKALDAHMLANGFRVSKNRPGAHETTALYAVAVLGSGPHAHDIQHFNRMRRNRNRSEYDFWSVGESTIRRDLAHAKGIIEAVEQHI